MNTDKFAHSDTHTLAAPQEGASTASHGIANALYLDAYAAPPPSGVTRQGPTTEKADWTLAVDLTASLGAAGMENQFHRLQSIAKESKGVPVDLIIQIPEPIVSTGGKTADPGMPRKIDRYLIHDGALSKLGNAETSKGFAGDVTDLLHAADAKAPSNHLGLIIQSHGGGPYGVSGDTGWLDLPQLAHSINDGLQGGSHNKLDVIDFDSCMMGHLKVAETMAPLASHMVASSSAENAELHGRYDGQNLQAAVRTLFHSPNMSGGEFSRSLIAQADLGENDAYVKEHKQRESGTPILAHFDLTNLPVYNDRLNDLGRALSDAQKDPQKREAIGDAIEDTRKPWLIETEGGLGLASEYTDMRSFTANLQHSLDSGELNDPAIQSAVKNLVEAQSHLIPQSHTDVNLQFDPSGQMSAFLPDKEAFEPRLAYRFDGMGDMRGLLGLGTDGFEAADELSPSRNVLRIVLQPKDLPTAQGLRADIDTMAMFLGSEHSAEIAELRKEVDKLASARRGRSFDRAVAELRITVDNLNESDFGHDLENKASVEARDNAYKIQNLQLPDWQSFIDNLR